MDLQKSIHPRHDREITQRASDAMLRSSSVHHDVVPLRLDPINVFDGQAGKPAVDAGVEILLRYAFDHAVLNEAAALLRLRRRCIHKFLEFVRDSRGPISLFG